MCIGPDNTYSTDLRSTDSDYHNTDTVTALITTIRVLELTYSAEMFSRGSYHLRQLGDATSGTLAIVNRTLTTLKDSLLYVP